MPSKKNLGRFPTILGDYNQAIHGKVDPEIRELFLDTVGRDIYYYSPAGEYVSLISLIRSGLVDTWLPPCVSLNAIKAAYPDPALSTVCAATDTGIIYEYVGNGNWVPISINALKIASEVNDGLMSIELYNAVVEYMNGPKEVYIEKNQPVPIPSKRKWNYYYNILKGISPSPAEIEWVEIKVIDSIESAIRKDWPYDQLFDVVIDEDDPDFGLIIEELDPLYHIVVSQTQVREEEVPEGYSGVFFMFQPMVNVEIIIPTDYITGSYPADWPYANGFYLDSDGNRYKIIDPGYLAVADPSEVKEVEPVCDVSDVFYDVIIETDGIMVETLIATPNRESAYPVDWPYANGFYTNDLGELVKIIDPGYLAVPDDSEVKPVEAECDVKNVYYDVDKSTHGLMIETLEDTPDKDSAYPDEWPYINGFYTNESGDLVKIVDPGYMEAKSQESVKKVDPACGVNDVYYDVDTTVHGVTVETLESTPDRVSAYPNNWPYANGFYTNDSGDLVKITDPGYLEATSNKDVKEVEPECDVDNVFYDVLKETT